MPEEHRPGHPKPIPQCQHSSYNLVKKSIRDCFLERNPDAQLQFTRRHVLAQQTSGA